MSNLLHLYQNNMFHSLGFPVTSRTTKKAGLAIAYPRQAIRPQQMSQSQSYSMPAPTKSQSPLRRRMGMVVFQTDLRFRPSIVHMTLAAHLERLLH